MSKCLNCGAKLSCGCQKRTASDGKSVCTGCLASYETSLRGKKASIDLTSDDKIRPRVTGITVQLGTP